MLFFKSLHFCLDGNLDRTLSEEDFLDTNITDSTFSGTPLGTSPVYAPNIAGASMSQDADYNVNYKHTLGKMPPFVLNCIFTLRKYAI
jgi:hypothetical protein